MIWNPRGSMWHRWDPHLHAPGTVLADQFRGDWEAYLAHIENSDPVVRALGVTDYFCIQTYKEVRKHKIAGRLQDVFLIFPNVEMRLNIKTASEKAINLHLLFSPDDPNHEYEIERILGQLRFKYKEQFYACNRAELIRLGRAFDNAQTSEDGAFRTGANQFKVTLADLQDLFLQEKKWLSKNCLIAVAVKSTDGTAGLQDDSSFAALRQEMERFADIIFSSSRKQREFWLGKSPLASPKQIETTYRALKPCMHGSDAHRPEVVAVPDLNRYCWIKGDLSFESLRQAVIEPEDRVLVAEKPPVGTSPSETLSNMTLEAAPWVTTPALPLNPGLITIIGARGSGKTALMEFLAAGSHALKENSSDSSFLQKAGDLLGNAQVKLTWGDGANETERLSSSDWYEYEGADPQVRYLSQQFVERLCSSAGLATELRQEMERVVFDATEQSDRMQCDTFDELANVLLAPIAEKRDELQQSIQSIGDEVLREDHLREQLPEQVKSIRFQKEAVDKIQRELKDLLPKENEAHTVRLRQLETICTTTEGKVEALRLRRKILRDLGVDVQQTIQSREPTRFQDLQRRFSGAGLSAEQWKAFRMAFLGEPATLLQNDVLKLDRAIESITSGDAGKPPLAADASLELMPLTQLRTLRDAARTMVGIDLDRQKKYQELQRALTQTESAVRRMETEHVHASGATERRSELIKRRKLEYVEVMKTLAQEEAVLTELYGPLRARLKESKGTLAKLAFVVERDVRLGDWVKEGEALIDLRKDSRFRGHGSLQKHAEERLLKSWKSGSPEDIANAMEGFIEEFTGDLMSALPEFTNDQHKAVRKQEIGAWLYDATHIKVQYGITYEGTPIERLSPGTRGIVLLLLYLAVDVHDRRPLFIDQPEENLDPYSVFTELVPHFRSAKKRRQIVVVTHNANLVVNTDADQIVVATSVRTQGAGLPQISYSSGSIENPMIRRSVCRLLEGGRRAFLEREGRYRIYTDDVVEGTELDD